MSINNTAINGLPVSDVFAKHVWKTRSLYCIKKPSLFADFVEQNGISLSTLLEIMQPIARRTKRTEILINMRRKVTLSQHALERISSPYPHILAQLFFKVLKLNRHLTLSDFADFVDPRSISLAEIQKIMRHGQVLKGTNDRVLHKGEEITVVTDKLSKTVITAFHHSRTKRTLSSRRKELFCKELLKLGNEAHFPQSIKKMINRVNNSVVKERDLHRKAARTKKLK